MYIGKRKGTREARLPTNILWIYDHAQLRSVGSQHCLYYYSLLLHYHYVSLICYSKPPSQKIFVMMLLLKMKICSKHSMLDFLELFKNGLSAAGMFESESPNFS